MTKTMMKINKKLEEMLSTVHIMDHSYSEMSRFFAVRWKDKLEHTWHLLDDNDNMHSVTYNQDLVNPTLLAGWIELRHFYGLFWLENFINKGHEYPFLKNLLAFLNLLSIPMEEVFLTSRVST
ncbi:hypothetical protein HKD37_11G031902 [Glycine soja]